MSPKQHSKSGHKIVVFCLSGVSLLVVAVLAIGLGMNPNKKDSPLLNKRGFPFNAILIQSGSFYQNKEHQFAKLGDFKGKILVLNFWASWCVSCRQEAAELERFWKDSQRDDVVVFGIAVQDEVGTAMEFARQFGKTYPLGIDSDGSASINYGVIGVPETFIIDRDGFIRFKHTGPVDTTVLTEYVRKVRQSRQVSTAS